MPGRVRFRRWLGSPWLHLAAAFVVVGLMLTFVIKPYVVPSASMEPAVRTGDRVLVDRVSLVFGEIERGDVVVFDADAAWEGARPAPANPLVGAARWVGEVTGFGPSSDHTLVKRVIGLPGEVVECCDAEGRIVVDGVAVDEPYVVGDLPFTVGEVDCDSADAVGVRSPRCFDAVTVPDGSYLVLGDARAVSQDSASACRVEGVPDDCWRWMSRDAVVGRATVVFWPLDRWGAVG